MARYRIKGNGVLDTKTGNDIPDSGGGNRWTEYQDWVTAGNSPDPEEMVVIDWVTEGRIIRNIRLSVSDWTHIVDSPLSVPKKAEWAIYRQALRDLPATYSDYSTVIWPTEPDA